MSRATFNGSSTGVAWPGANGFGHQYANHIKTLYDASCLVLSNVSGSDIVTADVVPALNAGLVSGMKFTIRWVAENTGPVTLNIGSTGAKPVKDARGNGLTAGTLAAGEMSQLLFDGTDFILLGSAGVGGIVFPQREVFELSGTWINPLGLFSSSASALVELWGPGGGGSLGRGAGGGEYVFAFFRLGDLPSSVTVTIGSGGPSATNGTTGGTTSFGSLLSAEGGQARNGGGVERAPGAEGTTGSTSDAGWSRFGGGGGGDSSSFAGPRNGGRSVYGGGGGGASAGAGGVSLYGGNGGASLAPGEAPGGGGGNQGAGARGEARVTVWQ